MQSPILKQSAPPTRVWCVLACVFSVSTVTLSLCPRPSETRAAKLVAKPISTAPPAHAAAEFDLARERGAPRANRDASTLDALIATVNRGEPRLSGAALEGIAQLGGDRARQFLVQRFYAAGAAELPALASALATLGDDQARIELQDAARSPRAAIRAAALDALVTLDTPDVRQFMLRAVDETDGSLSLTAATYFSDCREPLALPALERLARTGDSAQRRAATDALLAQGASAQPAIERLLAEGDELSDALLEGRPRSATARQALRNASIARLRAGAVTGGRVFEFLQRDLGRASREALVEAARDPASSESALNALALRGDIGSLGALSRLASDSDPLLAPRASCALLTQPDSRSRPFLLRSNRADLKTQTAAALAHINLPGVRPI